MTLPELDEMLEGLGRPKDREHIIEYGPAICPRSTYNRWDLDFEILQVTDCVVVSAEVSPAGAINLVNHCWRAAMRLLKKGVMVRGYITRGSIYHSGNKVIGSGYQNAYSMESEVTAFKRTADELGTPFIEVDQAVCDYIRDCGDNCVKTVFSRYVKGDGEVTAIFPFKALAHSIGNTGQPFNCEREKQSNQVVKQWINDLKKRVMELVDSSNPRAVIKAEHYMLALDAQLELCAENDEMLGALNLPYPSHTSE